MAAIHPFKRGVIQLLVVVAVASQSACAVTQQSDTAAAIPPALLLAKERYDRARRAYEEALSKCLRLSVRKLDGNPFDGLGLSAKQTEVAAYVMSERAMGACESDKRNNFAFEVGVYRAAMTQYGFQFPESLSEDEQALYSQLWRKLEKEAGEYATLSNDQRAVLENHPALQTPFDFAEFLSRLRKAEEKVD